MVVTARVQPSGRSEPSNPSLEADADRCAMRRGSRPGSLARCQVTTEFASPSLW